MQQFRTRGQSCKFHKLNDIFLKSFLTALASLRNDFGDNSISESLFRFALVLSDLHYFVHWFYWYNSCMASKRRTDRHLVTIRSLLQFVLNCIVIACSFLFSMQILSFYNPIAFTPDSEQLSTSYRSIGNVAMSIYQNILICKYQNINMSRCHDMSMSGCHTVRCQTSRCQTSRCQMSDVRLCEYAHCTPVYVSEPHTVHLCMCQFRTPPKLVGRSRTPPNEGSPPRFAARSASKGRHFLVSKGRNFLIRRSKG
jgi:hypothetical protein